MTREAHPGHVDGFILHKPGAAFYATQVVAYQPNDAFVGDPNSVLGQPDVFWAFPDQDMCDAEAAVLPLGQGGYVVVDMGEPFVRGDEIVVLELCSCGQAECDIPSGVVFTEESWLSVSIASDPNGPWLSLGASQYPPPGSFQIP